MEILLPIVVLIIGVGLNILNKVSERRREREAREQRSQAGGAREQGGDIRTARPRGASTSDWQPRTAQPRRAAEEPGGGPAESRPPRRPVSSVATWQCENCGVVLRKGGLGETIQPGADINRLDLTGVNTCALCGSRYPQAKVYGGDYDAHPQRAQVSREQLERRIMALRGRSDEVARRYLADAESQLERIRARQAPARPQRQAPPQQQAQRGRPQTAPQRTERAQAERRAPTGNLREAETRQKKRRSHARREADAKLGRTSGRAGSEAARDKGMSRLGRKGSQARDLMERDAPTRARHEPQRAYLARRRPTPGAGIPVNEWLQNPAELRKGIILREVLGPPKGLQRS